jgi:hypothetical protein
MHRGWMQRGEGHPGKIVPGGPLGFCHGLNVKGMVIHIVIGPAWD